MKKTVLVLLLSGTVFVSLAGKQNPNDRAANTFKRRVAITFDDLPMAGEQLNGNWDLDGAKRVTQRLLETLRQQSRGTNLHQTAAHRLFSTS